MLRVSVDELKWHAGHGLYTHEGTPFTGVAFEVGTDGALAAETEYRGGLRAGLQRMWHPDGSVAAEGAFRAGSLHGNYQEWHLNGQLALEQVGEYGILLSEKSWDEHGRLVKEYRIEHEGNDWQMLLLCRQLYSK